MGFKKKMMKLKHITCIERTVIEVDYIPKFVIIAV